MSARPRAPLALLAAALALGRCRPAPVVRLPPSSPATSRERTRVHMLDGTLYVLDGWRAEGDAIRGTGTEYSADRVRLREGAFSLRRADVALVETTERRFGGTAAAVAGMSLVTGASLAGTVACLTTPKACFGSCPTYYVRGAAGLALQAEGFSTSVARALEADDLDDLADARPEDGALDLVVRNEALETHFLRAVRLAVADAPPGAAAVLRADGGVAAVGPTLAPSSCDDAAACADLASRDGRELAPGSDGADLAARASVTLRFPAPGRRDAGLVLVARNSLMSTWVFYHLLALLGREAGAFIAALERREPAALGALAGFDAALGGVEVEVRQGASPWRRAGAVPYVGPLARGTRVVTFRADDPARPVEVRLSFARAHWRLDAARVGVVIAPSLPLVEVAPEVVAAAGRDARVVEASLRGEGDRTVMSPGDEARLRFRVPPVRGEAGFFLRSRGYYYEWLREAWLRDEDVPRARSLLADPRRALATLARAFRADEPVMESVFRASRFAGGAR